MDTVPKSESFWEDPPLLNHTQTSSGTMSQHPQHQPLSTQHSTLNNSHLQSYERNLNFSTVNVEDSDYGFQKKKSARDPLSHRIIEKRRRDRMNNCLADLARLLPQASLRKGRGRIEKTEIVELAIKHLKHLQSHTCPHGDNCEFSPLARQSLPESSNHKPPTSSSPLPNLPEDEGHSHAHLSTKSQDDFRLGYQECLKETMHFLMERKGTVAGDNFFVQLVDYLNRHAESFIISFNKNDKGRHGFSRHTHCVDVLSDGDNEMYPAITDRDENNEIDQKPHKLSTNIKFDVERNSRDFSQDIIPENHSVFEYDVDNNSCSSTPLSIETADVFSCDGKMNPRSSTKPPLPSIVGSHSSSISSAVLSSSNGRSSDEGSASTSIHRYKFKNTIKQRFNADLETIPKPGLHEWGSSKHHHQRHHHHRPLPTNDKGKHDDTSSSNPSEELVMDEDAFHEDAGTDLTEISEDEKPELQQTQVEYIENNEIHHPQLQPVLDESTFVDRRQVTSTNSLMATNENSPLPIISVTKTGTIATKVELRDSYSPLQKLHRSNDLKTLQVPGFHEAEASAGGVPAFVLHEKGQFYIPLTLEKSLVTPLTTAMDLTNHHPPLHPVTISVCFLFNPKEGQLGSQELKFPDLNVQSGVEALNLSTSPVPMNYGQGGTQSFYTSQGNSSFIMNRFAQSQSPHLSHVRDSPNTIDFRQSSNGPYTGFPVNSHQIHSGHSTNPIPKVGTPLLFPPFDFPGSRHVQNHAVVSHSSTSSNGTNNSTPSNFISGTTTSSTKVTRKRHFAGTDTTASTTSSMSKGYHSWRETEHSSDTELSNSTSGETNTTTYLSGSSFPEDPRVDGERSEKNKRGTSKEKRTGGTSPSKRQRKEHVPLRGEKSTKEVMIF